MGAGSQPPPGRRVPDGADSERHGPLRTPSSQPGTVFLGREPLTPRCQSSHHAARAGRSPPYPRRGSPRRGAGREADPRRGRDRSPTRPAGLTPPRRRRGRSAPMSSQTRVASQTSSTPRIRPHREATRCRRTIPRRSRAREPYPVGPARASTGARSPGPGAPPPPRCLAEKGRGSRQQAAGGPSGPGPSWYGVVTA